MTTVELGTTNPSSHLNVGLMAAAAVVALMTCSASAQDKTVTCTGALVDVWIKRNAEWPLAVIYDANGKYTCSIDRSGSGHDPLRPCVAGEKCRVTGTYRVRGIGEQKTYSIQMITALGTD
jgi:hypothetical protein